MRLSHCCKRLAGRSDSGSTPEASGVTPERYTAPAPFKGAGHLNHLEDQMTKREIVEQVVELEQRYGLLSADMIHQDDLFALQEKLADLLCKLGNEVKFPLTEKLPYLFYAK
jgi:hypothetical protein